MGKIMALVVVLGTFVLAPSTEAAISDIFGGDVTCTVQGNGQRHCSGIFTTFDGSPIDVNVGFPPVPASGPDGNFPIIGVFHGWGGSKLSFASMQEWLTNGYAVFSMSDRGWGNSCGAFDIKRLGTECLNGYNHLMDTRYEVRDAQEVFEALADQAADGAVSGEGLIDPVRIGSMGGSYGGGISMALGALRNRKMIGGEELLPVDGTLIPWMSPGGKSMEIAAVVPDVPWTDLAYSLLPNGHTLDYVEYAPYLERGRVGVMKQSFVAGLYGTGLAASNYAPPGADPDADINGWFALINAGDPYDPVPLAQDIADEVTRHHSSYYIDDTVAPAAMLISNGWTDDLFPVDEAVRFWNKTRTRHPGTPISLIFTSHGHQRGQSKPEDSALFSAARHEWFDHYVKGTGPAPFIGVTTQTQTCPNSAPPGGPFSASTWDGLAAGEFRLEDPAAQVIATAVPTDGPIGQAFDPISGPGACATTSAADQTGAATYRSAVLTDAITLMGSPTIIADILSAGATNQIAARLLDVDPGGDQTLVARGIYRPETGVAATCQVFQLHPNGYQFDVGHVVKLELLPADQPYGRNSNGQTVVTVENLRLRLPVVESPGGIVDAPSPKVLPAGYTLAADVTVGIDNASCPQASTTTSTSTTSSSTSSTAVTTTSTVVGTTTTTTAPPSFDLTLGRVRIRESASSNVNGSAVVRADFMTPPDFTVPPSFTVRIQDGSGFDLVKTYETCRTSPSGRILCREQDADGTFRVAIRRLRSGQHRLRLSFRRLDIMGPFAAPVTVTILHNAAVVRSDSLSNCRTSSARITCRP